MCSPKSLRRLVEKWLIDCRAGRGQANGTRVLATIRIKGPHILREDVTACNYASFIILNEILFILLLVLKGRLLVSERNELLHALFYNKERWQTRANPYLLLKI